MNKTLFALLFAELLLAVFLVYNYRVNVSTEYRKQSTEYEEHLSRACQAAVDIVTIDGDRGNSCIYDTDAKREKAVETFYQTLVQGFNLVNDSNRITSLRQHVPSLCLVDLDGYYMCYNVVYTAEDGGMNVTQTISPLNTWGYVTDDEKYLIRYYLTDYVEVTSISTGKTETGTFQSVYDRIGDEVGLKVLRDRKTYELYKTDFIISELNEKMEYYINNYNQSVNRVGKGKINDYDIHYAFELSRTKYEDWCNLLEKPAAMALLQGVQYDDGNQYLNVYAMSGGEVFRKGGYYVNMDSEDEYYHRPNCPLVDGNYQYQKSKILCAKQGYFPCEVCNP